MRYSKQVYDAAAQELMRRKAAAQALAELHRDQVLEKCPELSLIEEQMRGAVLSAVKLLNGGGGDAAVVKSLSKKNLAAQKERRELLKASGFPGDYLEEKYTCRLCSDTGFVEGRMCKCHSELLKQLACEELSRSSPSELCTFESFSLDYYPQIVCPGTKFTQRFAMKNTLEFCKKYAAGFSRASENLHFYGATGLGKTHLSLAIAGEVAKNGFGVVYITAQNLMNKLEKEHFAKDAQEDTIELVLECDLLIIDDLGTEFATSFTNAALYNIINTRLLTGSPVIVNSNLTVAELEEKYDQRLASRIGSFAFFEFFGTDIRQLMQNKK